MYMHAQAVYTGQASWPRCILAATFGRRCDRLIVWRLSDTYDAWLVVALRSALVDYWVCMADVHVQPTGVRPANDDTEVLLLRSMETSSINYELLCTQGSPHGHLMPRGATSWAISSRLYHGGIASSSQRDYFSKWVEVVPLREGGRATASSTS
jgi:hypothetical protein